MKLLFHRGVLALVVGVGMHIDVLGLQLVVEDPLAGIEPRVAREHKAQRTGQRIIQQALGPKKLDCQKGRGDRAVDRAAENADQSDGSGKARRNAQQRPYRTAEAGPDKETGDHFTALEAGRQRDGREQDFQKEGEGLCLPLLNGAKDDRGTGAVIVAAGKQQREAQQRCPADSRPHIGVGEKAFHLASV